MGLESFKRIYWWEWGHRLLGRVIGFAFLLPFLFFVVRGVLRGRSCGNVSACSCWADCRAPSAGDGRFGLTERVSVSQYRLAVHLTLACVILAATVAVARSLTPRPPLSASAGVRWGAGLIVLLVLLQIFSAGSWPGSMRA